MRKYTIVATRETAALYLAWEYGARLGQEKSKKLVEVRPAAFRVSDFATAGGWKKNKKGEVFFTSRASAEKFAAHVAQVAAFQQGKLGKKLGTFTSVDCE